MNKVLFALLTSAARVFGVTFLFSAAGILAAPDLSVALSLSLAAFIAALVATLRAVQLAFPAFTTKRLFGDVIGAWVDSGLRAGLMALLVLSQGWLAAPDWSNWRAGVAAIAIGVGTAVVRALQGMVTSGDTPAPHLGG